MLKLCKNVFFLEVLLKMIQQKCPYMFSIESIENHVAALFEEEIQSYKHLFAIEDSWLVWVNHFFTKTAIAVAFLCRFTTLQGMPIVTENNVFFVKK